MSSLLHASLPVHQGSTQCIGLPPKFSFYQPHCPDWYNIPTCPHMASILAQPHPEDGGSTILQNIGYYLPQNTVQHPKRLQSSEVF